MRAESEKNALDFVYGLGGVISYESKVKPMAGTGYLSFFAESITVTIGKNPSYPSPPYPVPSTNIFKSYEYNRNPDRVPPLR
jgi:hypothetical protein